MFKLFNMVTMKEIARQFLVYKERAPKLKGIPITKESKKKTFKPSLNHRQAR